MLSRFVTAFLPRSKCLNFMAAVTICSDFGAQEKKICHCVWFFPIYLTLSERTRCHDLIFSNIEFQAFSFFSFTLIKQFFNSSSLSAIRVVSYAYVRLLIFLLALLIPVCDLPSPAFHMMYKLNKQGDNIQPCCTPFPILNQFVVPYLDLTVAS